MNLYLRLIVMSASIRQVASKKPVHVKLKSTDSKYLTPTEKEDPILPALFVFQGMRGSEKSYACVQMCRHFEKKGTFNERFCFVLQRVKTTRKKQFT